MSATIRRQGIPVEIEAEFVEKTVRVSVVDHGPGIPETYLARIFDKFYRVPGTATGGTGLGLSISKGLVEAHGGTLTARNLSGGGLCLVITLPADVASPLSREADL